MLVSVPIKTMLLLKLVQNVIHTALDAMEEQPLNAPNVWLANIFSKTLVQILAQTNIGKILQEKRVTVALMVVKPVNRIMHQMECVPLVIQEHIFTYKIAKPIAKLFLEISMMTIPI